MHFQVQQECIPVGCVPSAAVAVGGVCLPGGCITACTGRGVSAPVHAGIQRGVSAKGCLPQCTLGYTPPTPLWTEFLTHACENITFPQLRCGRQMYHCKWSLKQGKAGEVSSVRTLTPWSESGLPGNMAGLSGALVTLVTCCWDGDGAVRPVDPIVNPDSPEPGEKLEPETKVSLYYFYFVIFFHDRVVLLLQLWLF